MRAILFLLMLANVSTGNDRTLRAKAALALAFAPPTYAEQRAKAMKEGKPLIVFVGQPMKSLTGCVCVAYETFPDVPTAGVVVGVPDGSTLRRIDLMGEPSETRIREAITQATPATSLAKLPTP